MFNITHPLILNPHFQLHSLLPPTLITLAPCSHLHSSLFSPSHLPILTLTSPCYHPHFAPFHLHSSLLSSSLLPTHPHSSPLTLAPPHSHSLLLTFTLTPLHTQAHSSPLSPSFFPIITLTLPHYHPHSSPLSLSLFPTLTPHRALRMPSYELSWEMNPGLGLTQDLRVFTNDLASSKDMEYIFIR